MSIDCIVPLTPDIICTGSMDGVIRYVFAQWRESVVCECKAGTIYYIAIWCHCNMMQIAIQTMLA